MSTAELHKRLRSAYPAKWDAETDSLAKSELKSMAQEFGERRTEEAVSNFIRSAQFFSVAGLRDAVPPVQVEREHLYDKDCSYGCMEGWLEVIFDDLSSADKNNLLKTYKSLERARMYGTKVKRCVCWKGQQ